MNVSGDQNRSVRNTKKRLRESLMRKALQMPIGEITVKELTEDADVNRSTFYFHYQDVKSLLSEMENEFFNDFSSTLDAFEHKPYDSILIFTKCLEAHMELCRIVLGENGDLDFLENLRNIIEKRISSIWKTVVPELSDEDLEVLDSFLIGGVLFTVQRWVREEPRQSAETLAAVLNSLIIDGICPVVAAWHQRDDK